MLAMLHDVASLKVLAPLLFFDGLALCPTLLVAICTAIAIDVHNSFSSNAAVSENIRTTYPAGLAKTQNANAASNTSDSS